MGRIAIIVFLFLTIGSSQTIINGGFETGDFTGWKSGPTSQVLTAAAGIIAPHSGTYFGSITGGDANIWYELTQAIMLGPGETISLFVAFYPADYLPYADEVSLQIIVSDALSSPSVTLYSKTIGPDGSNGAPSPVWQEVRYTTLAAGTFTISARARNILDSSLPSAILLDDVQVIPPTTLAE